MKLSFDDRYIPHHVYLKMIENGYFEDEVRKGEANDKQE